MTFRWRAYDGPNGVLLAGRRWPNIAYWHGSFAIFFLSPAALEPYNLVILQRVGSGPPVTPLDLHMQLLIFRTNSTGKFESQVLLKLITEGKSLDCNISPIKNFSVTCLNSIAFNVHTNSLDSDRTGLYVNVGCGLTFGSALTTADGFSREWDWKTQ